MPLAVHREEGAGYVALTARLTQAPSRSVWILVSSIAALLTALWLLDLTQNAAAVGIAIGALAALTLRAFWLNAISVKVVVSSDVISVERRVGDSLRSVQAVKYSPGARFSASDAGSVLGLRLHPLQELRYSIERVNLPLIFRTQVPLLVEECNRLLDELDRGMASA